MGSVTVSCSVTLMTPTRGESLITPGTYWFPSGLLTSRRLRQPVINSMHNWSWTGQSACGCREEDEEKCACYAICWKNNAPIPSMVTSRLFTSLIPNPSPSLTTNHLLYSVVILLFYCVYYSYSSIMYRHWCTSCIFCLVLCVPRWACWLNKV